MENYVLRVEYDGTEYSGWQRQSNANSIQAEIEQAWRGRGFGDVKTIGASRTDAGVHARGQVLLLNGEKALLPDSVKAALNGLLPADIVIRQAVFAPAPDNSGRPFNPRYWARGKYYTYKLSFGQVRPALDRRHTAYLPGKLDLSALRSALPLFLGERDFTALMDQGSPTKRSIRTLYAVDVDVKEDSVSTLLTFHIVGDGFLYHMVRILVGTAVMVGQRKLDLQTLSERLDSKKRVGLGVTMPPEGLCLEKVFYENPLFGDDSVQEMKQKRWRSL